MHRVFENIVPEPKMTLWARDAAPGRTTGSAGVLRSPLNVASVPSIAVAVRGGADQATSPICVSLCTFLVAGRWLCTVPSGTPPTFFAAGTRSRGDAPGLRVRFTALTRWVQISFGAMSCRSRETNPVRLKKSADSMALGWAVATTLLNPRRTAWNVRDLLG